MSFKISFEVQRAKWSVRWGLFAAATLLLSGCATIIRGPNTEFTIATEPPGAAVATDLEIPKWDRSNPEYYSCPSTPCTFEISRRSNFTVSIELDGYHAATVDITSGFGKAGSKSSTAGAMAGASGAYVVSYSVITATTSALSAVATAGMAGSVATTGAGSAAASGAAGVGL